MIIDTVKTPPVASLGPAGVTGVFRYLAYVQSTTDFKRITNAEYDATTAVVPVYLNWEMASTDWLGGAAAGKAHGIAAALQAVALGYPKGYPLPGSADFDMTRTQWLNVGKAYGMAYRQWVSAAGYWAGVYGSIDTLTWYHDEIDADGFLWQSMSTGYSGGRNAIASRYAHLWQRRTVFIGGQECDTNILLKDWTNAMANVNQDDWDALIWRVKGMMDMEETVQGGPTAGEEITIVKAIKALPTESQPNLATSLKVTGTLDLSE